MREAVLRNLLQHLLETHEIHGKRTLFGAIETDHGGELFSIDATSAKDALDA